MSWLQVYSGSGRSSGGSLIDKSVLILIVTTSIFRLDAIA